MATSDSDNVLITWYSQRIGEPSTTDEVTGYWLFVAGVLLGLVGVMLFTWTQPRTGGRGMAYALAALAPAFVMLGAVVRFPLRQPATLLGYGGLFLSTLGIVWFVSVYPGGWPIATGRVDIIAVYGLGLILIGLAGAVVPLLTEPLLTQTQRDAVDRQAADAAATGEQLDEARARNEELESQVSELQAAAAAASQSRARFELFADKSDKFRWRLRHQNGHIIADSGQGYTALHNAQNGLQSVRRNALGAGVLRIDPESDADNDPVPDDVDEPVAAVPAAAEEADSKATFEQYTDKGGEHRWRLRHRNGNIIADSSEGYSSASKRNTAVDRLKTYVGPADYLWFDPAGFELYVDNAEEWRWRLVHRNGNILADSGEGYSRRHDASRAVDRLRETVDDLEFNIYEDSAGEFRWRLQSDNGTILADSGEGYSSRSEANKATERVSKHAPEADTLEIGQAAFEIFEDNGGEFRWRLRHRNGKILADSGEGYSSRSKARDGIESVKRNAPGAAAEQTE